MKIAEWVQLVTIVGALAAGIFAFVKWNDQRKRELSERRFEQYWRLIETSLETEFVGKQKTALLRLKRYPEYKDETIALARGALTRGEPWAKQNETELNELLAW